MRIRDQTKVWHPDRFSNDIRLQKKAEDKLKQINLAYQRLCRGGPYEPPLLNPPTERYPPGWIAVFALRRALRKSVIAITKPFRLWMAKTVSVGNKVFQWCLRQRRSLAIATTRVSSRICFRRLVFTHVNPKFGLKLTICARR